MSSVAHRPLHRALGLTDGEFDRIETLLGRRPNDFELAVFSLLWSEHCGYKHSALLLKRFPTEGAGSPAGAGRERGRRRPRRGRGRRVQGREPQPSVRGRALPGRGDGGRRDPPRHRRHGRPPIALLDGLRFGEPGFEFGRAVGGIGHYGNCVGVPTVGGDTVFDDAYASNPLVNAMCVGLLPTDRVTRAEAGGRRQPRRPLRRDHGTRRDRRRERAREPGALRRRRGQAPVRPGRRPLHGQEADRGEPRARRRRPRPVAAGPRRGGPRVLPLRDGERRRRPRRPPRPRAAPRGRHGARRDRDLGEPGADGLRHRPAGCGRRRSAPAGSSRSPTSASSPPPARCACSGTTRSSARSRRSSSRRRRRATGSRRGRARCRRRSPTGRSSPRLPSSSTSSARRA